MMDQDGNVVAVRICAKFTWSRIAVQNGYLVIDIGDAESMSVQSNVMVCLHANICEVQPRDVQYTKLVSEIQVIQEVLHETNVQTHAAFTPQIPNKVICQADAFATADKTPLRVLSLGMNV
jgi:predicted RNase H-like nuclease (RuvC/YqgF family)